MADISAVTLLDGVTYNIKDAKARMVILSYGNSTWADFISAYSTNTVVYCRASSNSNPASGSQTRLAFMAYVNNGDNPTEVEFQYYRSVTSHSDSQQGDQVFVYKLTKTGGWTVTTRSAFTKIAAGTGLSGNYSNGTLTLNNTAPDTDTHRPIKVNGTQVLGDNITPLDIVAGSNITITENAGSVVISSDGTRYDPATTSANGLMSSEDKTALDTIYDFIYGTGTQVYPTNLVDLSLSNTSSKPLANYIVYNLFSDCAVNWRIDEETGLATLVNRFGDDIGDALDIMNSKTYRPSITNLLSDRTLTIGQGSNAILQYRYISVDENDIDDGDGIGAIVVNGTSTQSFTVSQGNNSYNVTNLLSPGENSVKVRVTNSEGTSRELAYTVILLSLSITTNLVTPNAYYGAVTFNYILSGYGSSKTVHFEMDGTELTSDTISTSGVTTTKVLSAQSSGVHTFRIWATTTVNNVSVTSDALTFSMIWSRAALPDISVEEDQYAIRYFNYDGTYLYGYAADSGDAAINPVTQELISAPTRSGTSDISYAFSGWADLPASVSKECAILAQYTVSYRVIFMNGSATFDTQWVINGNNASNPSTAPTKAEDNDYAYVFAGWTTTSGGTSVEANALTNVTAARTVYAVYTTINKYTVRFMNGTTVLQTSRVAAGNDATYTGTTPTSSEDGFVFNGWLPLPTNIQADTDCIAQFLDTNTEVNKFLRRTITSYESVASS